MGRLITNVPNMNHVVMLKGTKMIPGISDLGVKGGRMVAIIDESLDGSRYEEIAKQVRLLYAFSFQCVHSDSYQIITTTSGYHYTGHDERKAHLLSRPLFPTQKFLITSGSILEDLLNSSPPKNSGQFYNLLYLWVRAKELRELHMPQEGELLLWRITDMMHSVGSESKAKKLLKKLKKPYDAPGLFAARILSQVGEESRDGFDDEFVALYDLKKLQQNISKDAAELYMEAETSSDSENRNALLAEITRLYILWQANLDGYYLKRKGDIYKISKKVA